MRVAIRLVALALVAAIGLASVSGATSATARRLEVKVWADEAWSRSLDVAPKGHSSGDVVVRRDILRNFRPLFGKGTDAVVGRARYRTEYEKPKVAFVRATVTLPGGEISCRGRVDPREGVGGPNSWADIEQVTTVVGGTGEFAGATGSCKSFHMRPTSPLYQARQRLHVYRLTIPRS
jgi:hypothetical protein